MDVSFEFCNKCGKTVEVEIIDIKYKTSDCFMEIIFKCKECGEIGHKKIYQ